MTTNTFQDQEKQQQVSDGAKIGYRLGVVEKQPRVIAMLHGLASNSTRWSELVTNTSLKQKWDLLRIDMRGHGLSMYRGRFSRKRWSQDLREVINTEAYTDTVLLGHSQGAQVAMQYAMDNADGIKGMVLIDPVFDTNLTGMLGIARRLKPLLWALLFMLWFINLLGFRKKSFPIRDLYELDKQTRQFLAENPERDIAELYMTPIEDLRYIPLANYVQDIIEVVSPVGDISKITCPVLVLLSSGASMSDVEKNTAIIKQMPNSVIEYIDADHWLLTEKPDEARAMIERWINDLDKADH